MDVVVGVVYDMYVAVLEREDATRVAALAQAMRESSSYAELRTRCHTIDPTFLEGYLDDEVTDEEYPYDPDFMADDEYWPPPPLGITHDVVPKEVAAALGEIEWNPSGVWLNIDADREAELVVALQALGWTVTRDQKLVDENVRP